MKQKTPSEEAWTYFNLLTLYVYSPEKFKEVSDRIDAVHEKLMACREAKSVCGKPPFKG